MKLNPANPRVIKDDRFEQLVKSIQEFPEMMEKRPIVYVTDSDKKIYPLGGNMRLKAIMQIGYKEIPNSWLMSADEWTEQQRREFVIKDNVGFGEWDWDAIKEDWPEAEAWGVEVPDWSDEVDENDDRPQGHGLFPLAIILTKKDYSDWQQFKKGYGFRGDTEAFLKLMNENTVKV